MPVSCTAQWPLPRASSQRLTGTVSAPATASAKARLPQKSSESRPASIAPGIARTIALSMISIVVMLSVSEANATPATRRSGSPGAQQRQARESVAEDEGEHDREHDRAPVREARRGPDGHPGDLADRTAREAVQGRAHRERRQRAARGRHLVVVVVRGWLGCRRLQRSS